HRSHGLFNSHTIGLGPLRGTSRTATGRRGKSRAQAEAEAEAARLRLRAAMRRERRLCVLAWRYPPWSDQPVRPTTWSGHLGVGPFGTDARFMPQEACYVKYFQVSL